MTQEYTTTGRVDRGRLQVRNRPQLEAEFKKWKDGEVVVKIERAHATRSLQANAFYWAVVVHLISEYTGFTPDETHAWLKARFIPKRLAVANGNGEIVDEFVIGGSTTKLNKIEFGEYVSAIQQWAAETLDVVIPDPIAQDYDQRVMESARDLA